MFVIFIYSHHHHHNRLMSNGHLQSISVYQLHQSIVVLVMVSFMFKNQPSVALMKLNKLMVDQYDNIFIYSRNWPLSVTFALNQFEWEELCKCVLCCVVCFRPSCKQMPQILTLIAVRSTSN